jgi:hypothetical protein
MLLIRVLDNSSVETKVCDDLAAIFHRSVARYFFSAMLVKRPRSMML